MYRGNGYLPFCNTCVEEMYNNYVEKLRSREMAMRRICMKLDLYWNKQVFELVERTSPNRSIIRNYIGKLNIVKYLNKTYDDTLAEEAEAKDKDRLETAPSPLAADSIDENELDSESSSINPELINFWGGGFNKSFYEELESRYNEWTGGKEISDPTEKALYKQICILEATINRDTAMGKAIDKSVNALNSLLGSMNLKPTQKKEDAETIYDKTPMGVWIKRWEDNDPVPESKPSGLVKYITVWFLGHLCKMAGIKNSYCKMYEDEIAKIRVEHPEYEEEDDEDMLNDIFGGDPAGTDKEDEQV